MFDLVRKMSRPWKFTNNQAPPTTGHSEARQDLSVSRRKPAPNRYWGAVTPDVHPVAASTGGLVWPVLAEERRLLRGI